MEGLIISIGPLNEVDNTPRKALSMQTTLAKEVKIITKRKILTQLKLKINQDLFFLNAKLNIEKENIQWATRITLNHIRSL